MPGLVFFFTAIGIVVGSFMGIEIPTTVWVIIALTGVLMVMGY